MVAELTVGERIIIHLSHFTKLEDSFDAPIDITQDGIAAALRISRAHAALELKKLKESKEVTERLSHIKKGRTKRKVYFLTRLGAEKSKGIKGFAEEHDIDLSQYQDIRKCKGPEIPGIWASIDDKFKPVVAMSCVFRKPFSREALPDISVSLLPVDEKGMVDLPREFKEYVLSVTDIEKARDYHCFAADYWTRQDDLKEMLYHYVMARRFVDAEILVNSRYKELLLTPDDDLLEAVSEIRDVTKGYSSMVHYVQAEVARRVGRGEYCLILTKVMEASSIPSERFNGYMVEGMLHMDRKEWHLAYRSFIRARGMYDDHINCDLECNIAESLIQNGDYHEPKEVLLRLLKNGFDNPEDEARANFLLGTIAMKTGDDDDAMRLFNRSRQAMIRKQVELLTDLSEAYTSMAMRDKAVEYELVANNLRFSK